MLLAKALARIARPRLPGRHEREQHRADHQREPAAVGDLEQVRAEEREVDDQEADRERRAPPADSSPSVARDARTRAAS